MPTLRQLSLKGRMRKKRRSLVAALKGSPQRKAVVIKMSITTPRKPNSAKRRYARVRVLASKKLISAHPPGLGSPFIQQYSIVMVEGGSPPDTPGINYSLIRGVYDFCLPEEYGRRRRRSKFGKKRPDLFFESKKSEKDRSEILKSLIIKPVQRTKEEWEFYNSQLNALKRSKQKLYERVLNNRNQKLRNYIRMREQYNKPLSKETISNLFKKNEKIAYRLFKVGYAKAIDNKRFWEKKKLYLKKKEKNY